VSGGEEVIQRKALCRTCCKFILGRADESRGVVVCVCEMENLFFFGWQRDPVIALGIIAPYLVMQMQMQMQMQVFLVSGGR
jgi:hypothetical protein